MSPEEWDVPLPGFEPAPAKKQKHRTLKDEQDERTKVVYHKFKSAKRVHCEDCIDEMLAAGVQRYCYQAAYTRTFQGVARYLCYRHVNDWREKDDLEALRNGGW